MGLTLVEMLIALAILGLVVMLATGGIANGLRVDRTNQAAVSTQQKLRRVTEVYTQELRSAVLGGLSTAPYVPGEHQVSFITLAGAAGYPVLPEDSGNNASFPHAHNLRLQWSGGDAAAQALDGQQMTLVNSNDQAITFTVTNVQALGDGSYRVVHDQCANTIDYTAPRTVALSSRTVGFRFDPASGDLYMKEGSGPERVMAFGLDSVVLQYVYQAADGSVSMRSSPLTDGGVPTRTGVIAGKDVTLARVGLVLSASARTMGSRTLRRTYSGMVEMADTGTLLMNRVESCK